MSKHAHRAVFLDKDGTLVEDVPYNVDPTRIRLTTGAADALRLLSDAGYWLIVVTNQSGVARGLFPVSAMSAIEERISELVNEAGARFDGFYYCPHLPEGAVSEYAVNCDCRKPAPGLITRAAAELGIDLGNSWMVGDKADDVEAGRRAGCRTVLITRPPTVDIAAIEHGADGAACDLASAARFILSTPTRSAIGEKAHHGHD